MPPLGFSPQEHVIHHVAGVVAERARIGMRDGDGRLRHVEHVMLRLRRCVRHVDQQAERVHAGDHLPPEIGEPVVARLVGRAVDPMERLVVAERHHPRAQRMEDVEHLQPSPMPTPLSTPMKEAILPCRRARATSEALSAGRKTSGCSAFRARIDWISFERVARGIGLVGGQKPPRPARRRSLRAGEECPCRSPDAAFRGRRPPRRPSLRDPAASRRAGHCGRSTSGMRSRKARARARWRSLMVRAGPSGGRGSPRGRARRARRRCRARSTGR